jgi:hypothetical protein
MGWELEAKSPFGMVVSHTGDNPGDRTIIVRYIEENETIIILNNNAHKDIVKLVEAAMLSLYKWQSIQLYKIFLIAQGRHLEAF